jgi:hypothetical protein
MIPHTASSMALSKLRTRSFATNKKTIYIFQEPAFLASNGMILV